MSPRFRVILAIVSMSAGAGALQAQTLQARTLLAPTSEKPPIQGVTISTHGSGRDWGTDRITECIRSIKDVGANWVSIHPYARIHHSGRVTFASFDPENPPEHFVRPIREAHAQGLKIFVKPHLAYWGSPFKWRGEIEFTTDAAWTRFFKSYKSWIVAMAQACKHADGFAVGTELDRTISKVGPWRDIIASVRKVTKSPLTYAANWTDYTEVGFWDALDIIGIQAYFPLSTAKPPRTVDLRAGWRRTMADLRRFAAKQDRNIVFTELGYNTSFDAASRPWDARSDGPAAAPLQRACMAVALQAIAEETRVEGAFLWKWFPPPSPVGRDFPLATPEMKQTLRRAWGGTVDRTGGTEKSAQTRKR